MVPRPLSEAFGGQVSFVGHTEEAARDVAQKGGWADKLAVTKTSFKANSKVLLGIPCSQTAVPEEVDMTASCTRHLMMKTVVLYLRTLSLNDCSLWSCGNVFSRCHDLNIPDHLLYEPSPI